MDRQYKDDSETRFARLLARCRGYWRGRRVAEGLLLAFAVSMVLGFAAIVVMDLVRFDNDVVSALRSAALLCALLLLLALVVRPALKSASDDVVAIYLEKQSPNLDALLLSAVESTRATRGSRPTGSATSDVLTRRLRERAIDRGAAAWREENRDRKRLRRALGAVAVLLAAVIAVAYWGPSWLRHGMGLMFLPAADALVGSPYSVQVRPGDVEINAGSDLEVVADAVGFSAAELMLNTRPVGQESWTSAPMQSTGDGNSAVAYFFNVDASAEYFVGAKGVQSDTYLVAVRPRPEVQRVDLTYYYPAQTGRSPERVIDGGDIRAVIGTRVEVVAVTNGVVDGGELVVDGERRTELQASETGWAVTLEVQESGLYRIELPGAGGEMLVATPEYTITALDDSAPSVSLVRPGRDVHATRVEEVEVEVQAVDDVAVRGLALQVSVNGGPEQTLTLDAESSPQPRRSGGHVFFLEDLELEPGDLIAYYARAWDAEQLDRSASTDIQFIEIRPFERTFRAGRSGGAGAGAGGQNEQTLTSQQRALVVALFKFVRDHELMEVEELNTGVGTLIEAQQRIRTRVEAISRRLQARSIVEINPGYKRMAEELPDAASAMVRAEALLAAQDLAEALPQARKALSHLQRADAAFREVTIAQSRGGGGQNSDLTNLFRLELDKLRSQYADVNRASPGNAQTELDEVMRRLQELARRQQREVERARRRAEQGRSGSASQQQLAAELEELVRELERLTRERQNDQLRQTKRQLQQAAEQMRQAGSGKGGGDAEQQALRRLQQAQRQLAEDGRSQTAAAISDTLQQAESIAREQQSVEGELDDLKAGIGDQQETVSSMLRRKEKMIEQTDNLESDLARLAQESRATQPEAADKVREALTGIRESTLTRRIERSGKRLSRNPETYKPLHEEAINRELGRLRQRLAAAAEAVEEGEEERSARAMERLRGMIRERSTGERQMSARGQRGNPAGGGVAESRAGGRRDGLGTRFDGDLVGGWSRADAEQLAMIADDLPLAGRMAQDIENLIGALESDATREWQASDAAEIERVFSERLRQLQDIELDLRTAQERAPTQPLATREIEPQRADREAVETYFRNLSENSP